MNPEYGLRVGSKAPLVGTLMRITSAQRTRDSRIMMVVQGLARVRVIEPTQQRPFARADVQILPDAELSAECYREVRHFFDSCPAFEECARHDVAYSYQLTAIDIPCA
jgi:Lon protease-like protein